MREELAKPTIKDHAINKQIMRIPSTEYAIENVVIMQVHDMPSSAKYNTGRKVVVGIRDVCNHQPIKLCPRKCHDSCDKPICNEHCVLLKYFAQHAISNKQSFSYKNMQQ